jgi:hypothetical protein
LQRHADSAIALIHHFHDGKGKDGYEMKTQPDGCSVPKALRLVIPMETPAQIAVCNAHDVAYIGGGTRRDRAIADAKFLLGLLQTGMNVDLAEKYHVAVRIGGKPHWNGGYTDEPDVVPRGYDPALTQSP